METVNLSKKKIVKVNINNKDCTMCLDTLTIDHFQRSNKIGLAKALESIQKGEVNAMYKLICSMVRDSKTNTVLGEKYFGKFDDFQVVQLLQPALMELFEDLPTAGGKSEKK